MGDLDLRKSPLRLGQQRTFVKLEWAGDPYRYYPPFITTIAKSSVIILSRHILCWRVKATTVPNVLSSAFLFPMSFGHKGNHKACFIGAFFVLNRLIGTMVSN